MSDKSFGDHTNRNIVKNPLLSSAVTDVSLEDLTNKAILLPVTPSQGLITRPEPKDATLEHHESKSEDQNANPKPQPAKDDFDVNEYFARLQGTRYVSAPANSHIEENSNLEPADGLEEINLEPETEQQSLTADIAQNFSQLPNVLPHVASAVFSSFSNMLSYKSKEKEVEKEADKEPQVKPISDAPWANPVLDDAPPPRRASAGAGKKPRTKPKKRYIKMPGLVDRSIPIYIFDRPKNKNPDTSEEVDPATLDKLDKEEHIVFANPDDFKEIVGLGITQEQLKGYVEKARETKEIGMPSSDSDSQDDDDPLEPPTSSNVDSNGSYFASQIQSGYLPPHSSMQFIPPPPIFAGKCSQSTHKSVLPPSVARRISANQPIIRPQEFVSNIDLDNIFIPTLDYKQTQNTKYSANNSIAFSHKCWREGAQMPSRSLSPPQPTIFVPTFAEKETGDLSQPTLSETYVTPTAYEPTLLSNTHSFDQQQKSSNFIPMFSSSSNSTPSTAPQTSSKGEPSAKDVEIPAEIRQTVESAIPMNTAIPGQEIAPTILDPTQSTTVNQATANIDPNTSPAPAPTFYNPLQYQTPATLRNDEATTNIGPHATNPAQIFFNPLQYQTPLIQSNVEKITNIGSNATNSQASAPTVFNPLQYQTPATQIKDEATTNIGPNATNRQASAPTFFNPLQYQTPATQIKNEATTNIGPNAPNSQASAPTFFNPLQYQTPATQIKDEATTNIGPNATNRQASAPTFFNPLKYQTPATQIKDEATTNIGPNAPNSQASAPTFFNPLQYQTPATQIKDEATTNIGPNATNSQASSQTFFNPLQYQTPATQIKDEATTNIGPNATNSQASAPTFFNPLQYQTPATQIKDEATTNIGPNATNSQASSQTLFNPLQYQTPATQIKDEATTNIGPNVTNNQASAPTFFNPLQYQTPVTQIKDEATTNIGPNATNSQASAPTFFNPLQYQTPATQSKEPDVPTEPAKPLTEPPKSTGASNYRMTKKRPQYYSGPIEGVGAISNNVKPIIPPVETGFQGAILAAEQPIVPAQPIIEPTIEAPTMMPPFDISKPKYTESEYTTAFDLSRPTTEMYEQQQEKQESKTFGLIGSLKSKLSSLDINKIQNTVTTFFDPAYNEPKEEPTKHDTQPSLQQNTDQHSNQNNFEIFVPTVEQPIYNQYDYSTQQTSYYGQTTQYFQANPYYDQGQATMPNVYDQNYYNTATLHTTVQQPIIEPQTVADVKTTEEINTIPRIDTSTTASHSDIKIDDTSKTEVSELQTKVESSTTIVTSNIPVEIKSSAAVTDVSAKNFFDSPFVADYSIRTVETSANVDLQYATGDKAEANIKPEREFTFIDNKTVGGEDRVFDGVMSSIIGQYYALENNAMSKPVDLFRPDVEDTKPLLTESEENPKQFINNPPLSTIPKNFGNVGDKANIQIRETNLLESLITDAIPIVAVSSVPFFGLSTIIADKSKETKTDVKPPSLFDPPKEDPAERRVSITFYANKNEKEIQNLHLSEADKGLHKNIADLTTELQNVSLFESPKDQDQTTKSIFDDYSLAAKVTEDGASELSICETCREVTKHEEKDSEDVTTQLIDNLTSRIQLSNPVEATLTEGETTENRDDYDRTQFAEITHITEETIDTINVQSATELLDDDMKEVNTANFGWCNPETYSDKALSDHDYSFKLDSNSMGFFGNNSLFFDNVPNNASDEIKAEFKNSHEDMLSRQVSIPSAPPLEDDSKSDETGGLDVHLIEQDAKKDFPIDEEFVIEPSETDDDKIEYKEREKSEDSVPEMDSFTNRVEKFKKMEEVNVETEAAEMFDRKCLFELKPKNSPAISIASYFDTGNYAAETHYKNSLNSPSNNLYGSPNIPIRIPPGFEEEYHRRMSGISLQDKAEIDRIMQRDIRYVPETSTQTRHSDTATYVSSPSEPTEVGFDIKSNLVSLVEDDPTPIPASPETAKSEKDDKTDLKEPNPVKPLPDPINFFSQPVDNVEAPESFNRLASYFASPKENKSFFDSNQNKADANSTETHKSFFELSQGQNHYMDRNLSDEKLATLNVMRDLTSVQNIAVTTEQVVRTVNYFTVEYDKIIDDFKPSDHVKENLKVEQQVDDNLTSIINCNFCFKNNLVNIVDGKYKVRQSTNDNSEGKRDSEAMEASNDPRRSVTLNLDNYSLQDDSKDGVAVTHENRSSSEYSPVKYHWFYSVDIDDKSVWRGFSITDSRALEDAYNSPDLNETTVVATDGGRYDVNVVKRTRTAVYWSEKPTDVSRCSWFYKGPTDARYVPYSETVAEKLEEEYHHGMTTGEWHRRLLLPNSELVVMHGPSVMVHFLHSGAADAFSSPPLFAFGKRMYRNPPKIHVARDQPGRMDHLVLLVHGVGEYRSQKEKIQTTSRPRVVRRGHEESEIEDPEPSSIDHLLLLCHGVGSACDMRFRPVEQVVDDFRATSLQLVQSHYKNSYDNGVVSRVEVLPISWHSTLHSGESGVDRRLAQITLDSIPRLRNFTNDTVLDVLFYTSPVYCQTIIDTVCSELNRIYNLFISRNPTFKGRVSLGGHSLGSVILYDLLCHQTPESQSGSSPDKKLVTGSAGTGQPSIKYPSLQFRPAAMYALGSPIAMFECIRGVESLGTEFSLPTCDNFFNIFHPYDPIAYRIEPLINPKMREVKPSLIPHHKGRKRMHLELKDTMSRVGADLKQKLLESLRTTWNKWMSQPPTDGQLEKVVEEEMEKEQLCDENKEEFEKQLTSSLSAGRLNGGRRVDYVLQEAPLELINEYLFAMRSHVGYWESEDTMLMMLREIYSALGVQPDCTVPQQSMTVQRTTFKDETIIIDHPSTSRGGT